MPMQGVEVIEERMAQLTREMAGLQDMLDKRRARSDAHARPPRATPSPIRCELPKQASSTASKITHARPPASTTSGNSGATAVLNKAPPTNDIDKVPPSTAAHNAKMIDTLAARESAARTKSCGGASIAHTAR